MKGRNIFAVAMMALVLFWPALDAAAQRGGNRGHGKGTQSGEWLRKHRGMPLDQQRRALQEDPAFQQMAPKARQRMLDRLERFNRLSPQEQEMRIKHLEAMDRMTPEQRDRARRAFGRVAQMPPERRRALLQAFHGLRIMDGNQRRAALDGQKMKQMFNDEERATLSELVEFENLADGIEDDNN